MPSKSIQDAKLAFLRSQIIQEWNIADYEFEWLAGQLGYPGVALPDLWMIYLDGLGILLDGALPDRMMAYFDFLGVPAGALPDRTWYFWDSYALLASSGLLTEAGDTYITEGGDILVIEDC